MSGEVHKSQDISNGSILQIEQQLTALDPNIFVGVSQQKKQQIIKSVVFTMKSHSGPLPSPETLSEYSVIIPNGAERIMIMAEKQLDHRIKLEEKVISSQLFQSNLGQVLAFLIGLAALGSCTYCIINDHEFAGSIIGLSGLTGLVTAFIKGRSHQRENLEEKNPKQKR